MNIDYEELEKEWRRRFVYLKEQYRKSSDPNTMYIHANNARDIVDAAHDLLEMKIEKLINIKLEGFEDFLNSVDDNIGYSSTNIEINEGNTDFFSFIKDGPYKFKEIFLIPEFKNIKIERFKKYLIANDNAYGIIYDQSISGTSTVRYDEIKGFISFSNPVPGKITKEINVVKEDDILKIWKLMIRYFESNFEFDEIKKITGEDVYSIEIEGKKITPTQENIDKIMVIIENMEEKINKMDSKNQDEVNDLRRQINELKEQKEKKEYSKVLIAFKSIWQVASAFSTILSLSQLALSM